MLSRARCGSSSRATSYSDTYTGFTAPAAGYFRLHLVARDSANNTSVAALSDTFTPSGDKLFYYGSPSGYLYCFNISSSDAWCDNATSLGPPGSMQGPIRGPNQLTWLDDRNLLVSNYRGEILKLDLDELP